MIAGATGSASFSHCGAYRWSLLRQWDARPKLLVCMFNPSTANDRDDDQTVTLLCHIAAHNGFGGVEVINAIPLCSSIPAPAVAMANWRPPDWESRDILQENLARIEAAVGVAGAVLLAWGALGARCPAWMEQVLGTITDNLPRWSEIYCLAKTKGGHPKHPMARGKHKVSPDALLIPWSAA